METLEFCGFVLSPLRLFTVKYFSDLTHNSWIADSFNVNT